MTARWIAGTAIALLIGASGSLLDGPSDMQAEADTAAALRDALAQQQAERPDLWTQETRDRAEGAVRLITTNNWR